MIKIGMCIYSILSNDNAVKGFVGNKIFPMVISENTQLPCIVYERSSDIEYSRDGSGISTALVDIYVLSTNYTECINISQSIYNALNLYKGTVEGINIIDSRLASVDEAIENDAYIQKLTFQVKSL